MIQLIPVSKNDKNTLLHYLQSYEASGHFCEGNVGMLPHMDFTTWFVSMGDGIHERCHMIILDDIMIGTLDFRMKGNADQRMKLGDIGYSIHPDYRNQGYATQALNLGIAMYPASELIITCLRSNQASAKVIERNGGLLRNTFLYDGIVSNRYVIKKEDLVI